MSRITTEPQHIAVSKMAGGSERPRNASSQRRMNGRLAWFLMAVVALAPIPLGSNRPAFWAISAILIALAAMVYSVAVWAVGAKYRFPLKRISASAILFFVFAAFLIVQVMPLGTVFVSRAGFEIPSATLSIAPGETALMLMRQLSYGLFFFLTLQVAVNPDRSVRLLRGFFAIVTAHALFGMVSLTQLGDTVLFLEKSAYFGVATGTFINRNSFATFLAMGGVAGLSLLLSDIAESGRRSNRTGGLLAEGRIMTIGHFVALVIVCAALIATQSRMGTFAFLGGASTVGAVFAFQSKSGPGRTFGLVAAIGGVALVVLGIFFGAGLVERLGSVETSFDVRLDLYRQVLGMIMQRPFTGFGGGSFELAYPLFHQPPVSPDLIWDKAHSSYLALWVELGMVFGTIPMLVLALLILKAWPGNTTLEKTSPVSAAAIGASAVVALHSLLDFSLEIQANVWLYLALLALGVARNTKSPRKQG